MSERLTYVEIDLLKCSLNYGESPCMAALGVTGDKKCFNTVKTCQNRVNFASTTETLRLAFASEFLPPNIDAMPNIRTVAYTPSKLDLGASIGARATLTITCHDHPTPDTGAAGDKYLSSRNYNPFNQGTFWGKFKARHPYLRGRTLRWYNGKVGDSLESMEVRSYIIDRIEGPDAGGAFKIVAKDPLTLIDDKLAQAPKLSRGRLNVPINASTTSLTLRPAGIGNEDYPTSGKVAIGGNEIVSFTRVGDVMTIVRAQHNTEAQEHDEDDRVQLVMEYNAQNPADIIYDLMVNYGNVPSEFINLDNWKAEVDEFIARVYTGVIAEPTSVVKLVNEMLEQAALSVWWDETSAQLRLQVLRSLAQSSQLVCDDLMLAKSFKQKDQPAKRISQVWTYYGQINPLESQDDPTNYRNSLVTVSALSEENHGTPSIKRIYSRWITQFGRTAAERLNNLLLSRYSEPPKVFSFAFLRDSGVIMPELGSAYNVCSFINQDDEGNAITSPCQAIQVKVSDSKWEIEAEEVLISEEIQQDDPTVKVVPIDADTFNFNLRTAYLQTYIEAVPGDTVICEIREGVVTGSTSTSIPAFDTGTGWPSGVSIKLRNFGIIAGCGGQGGSSYAFATLKGTSVSATNGANGGVGVRAEVDIEIDNKGIIGGGGGGGAGAAATISNVGVSASGGGGAGFGLAGVASRGGNVLTPTGAPGTAMFGGIGNSATSCKNGCSSATSGAGGALGQPGSNSSATGSKTVTRVGGQPGNAVQGNSLITWVDLGDIRGNRV